ncbi:hypothetical protein BIY24_13330 [Halobacteriovorax marinus]|uniref:Exported protein n=1 Tax=Halobacteriovorax marinus (strain ATCC BAA-682 / DSM 15412 / SJ) TaxID=862908 RepID=E1WY45_HALMS|nr:hypothetical protein [Halobacteriovorax marinus]ATH08892.1 hypothetical protein BIY24_13330 [Halobacteriovorax marinus]CBW27600.1 putative exported protein [Halobacteriovorax marinus SJ]
MKYLSLTLLLFSLPSWAGGYLELSGGVLHKQLKGDSKSYKSSQSFLTEASLGHQWVNWDFSLDTMYSIGRQKDFNFSYLQSANGDDYNWHSVSVGPTLKYHIYSESGTWSWAPFAGVFYNHTSADNSAKFTDLTTGKTEDNSHESWGYGGKLGVQFKQYTQSSSWVESISYKVFGSYTKYRKTEGDYLKNNRILEFKGDTPDKLHDYSVGVSVGFAIGDKLFSKAKNAVGLK